MMFFSRLALRRQSALSPRRNIRLRSAYEPRRGPSPDSTRLICARRTAVFAFTAFLLISAAPAAGAGPTVPFTGCDTSAFNCTPTPPYHGEVADTFPAAAQQFCEWFAAAHYIGAQCPCDGTICSTVVSCEFRGILPGYEGSSQPKGQTAYTMQDSRNGNLFTSAGNTPTCYCPPADRTKLPSQRSSGNR